LWIANDFFFKLIKTSTFEVFPSLPPKNDPAAPSVRSRFKKKRDRHKQAVAQCGPPVLAALISLQRPPRSHSPKAFHFHRTLARSNERRIYLFIYLAATFLGGHGNLGGGGRDAPTTHITKFTI
jgi:hypothetical protein